MGKNFNLHWRNSKFSKKALKKVSNYQMPTIAFVLIWEFQPCRPNSILAPGAQLHLPLVVEEFLPFLLFSLPLLILSKNLVLQMPDFFQRLVAVLHTSLNSPLCKKRYWPTNQTKWVPICFTISWIVFGKKGLIFGQFRSIYISV